VWKRKEEEDDRKKEEARKQNEEEDDRKKEEARQRKEEEDRKKEDAGKRKEEEDDRKKEETRQQKEEAQRKEEAQKKEQEEHARQRKKEQEEQVPKTRGKYKTFDDRMEDLKLFKPTHGHVNVSISEDNSLAQFCAQARHKRTNPGKSKSNKLTIENIARLNALGLNWRSQEYVTRSFDERTEDLKEYKRTHGHLSVKIHKDSSLYQFCAGVRHSLKQVEKDGTRKLTEERIARLDALGFEWS
jgi:hypothetical protein